MTKYGKKVLNARLDEFDKAIKTLSKKGSLTKKDYNRLAYRLSELRTLCPEAENPAEQAIAVVEPAEPEGVTVLDKDGKVLAFVSA